MNARFNRRVLRLATFAAVVTISITAAPLRAQQGGVMVGAMAPAASVVTLDGTMTNLDRFYGDKPVVLEFWATWCPLCKALEPGMQAARAKYAARVNFVSVGVSSNQTALRQREYADKQRLTGQFVFDEHDAAVKAFMVPHTSYIVIVDRHRKVVYTGVGEKQDIDAAIRKVLDMEMD